MASFMPQRRPTTPSDRFTAPSLEHAARTTIPQPDADAILRDQPTPARPELATLHRPLTPIPLFRPDTSAPRFAVPQLKQASVATEQPSASSASSEAASSETAANEAQDMMLDAARNDVGRAHVTVKQMGSGTAPIPPNGGNPPPVQRKNFTGLPDALKAGIEALSGIMLDDVRVHYNSPKAAQIGALAYAQGAEIHVGPGQERHLPHEAWHVVQQKQGRVQPTLMAKGLPINDDHTLEREADAIGERVVRSLDGTATQARERANAPGTPAVQRRNRVQKHAYQAHAAVEAILPGHSVALARASVGSGLLQRQADNQAPQGPVVAAPATASSLGFVGPPGRPLDSNVASRLSTRTSVLPVPVGGVWPYGYPLVPGIYDSFMNFIFITSTPETVVVKRDSQFLEISLREIAAYVRFAPLEKGARSAEWAIAAWKWLAAILGITTGIVILAPLAGAAAAAIGASITSEAAIMAYAATQAGRAAITLVLTHPIETMAVTEFAVGTVFQIEAAGGIREFLEGLSTAQGIASIAFDILTLRMSIAGARGEPARTVEVETEVVSMKDGTISVRVTRPPVAPEAPAIRQAEGLIPEGEPATNLPRRQTATRALGSRPESDFSDVGNEVGLRQPGTTAPSASRNVFPDFELILPAQQATATAQTQRLSQQLGIPIPPDKVLSAPWVGRIRNRMGEIQSSSTSQGWLRNESRFWSEFKRQFRADYRLLGPNRTVSRALAQRYGWPESTVGQRLVHHHIDNGPYVVAIPESVHQSKSGIIHARPTTVNQP